MNEMSKQEYELIRSLVAHCQAEDSILESYRNDKPISEDWHDKYITLLRKVKKVLLKRGLWPSDVVGSVSEIYSMHESFCRHFDKDLEVSQSGIRESEYITSIVSATYVFLIPGKPFNKLGPDEPWVHPLYKRSRYGE